MSPSDTQSANLASNRRLGVPGASAPPRVLILGYGNPGRQDDGLGPAVAEQIDALGLPHVTAYENYQLNIEDALEVADNDVVWFVDAARSGPSPFAFEPLAPAASLEFTSHLVRPEAILAMAHQYYGATPQAFLLGIRGYEFEFAEGLTNAATENLQLAVEMLKGRLSASQPVLRGVWRSFRLLRQGESLEASALDELLAGPRKQGRGVRQRLHPLGLGRS